jgi:hypothetical protein
MCYVQIAGMLVATLVTLVIVPVLYVIFVEDLHLVRWETETPASHHADDAHPASNGDAHPQPAEPQLAGLSVTPA